MTQAVLINLWGHLWQSTLFALAAGLMTAAFRGNRAQVRYWLWLSASLKFLVPFAVLLNLGSYLETWMPAARQIATPLKSYPIASYTIEHFSAPFLPESLPAPAPEAIDWIPLAIFAVWLAGFLAVASIRLRSWLRVREAVHSGATTDISQTVKIRVTRSLLGPGVVGIVRPVILLPEGIAERLTPPELETVLAHELCHIHRRDNLFAAIHMIVEAVFWFHPLVWRIGTHLVEERERTCDEEVVSRGSHPEVYADAILNVCKLYAPPPLACVSGVSGANGATIRRRIEAIMLNRGFERLSRAKKFLLAGAGTAALAGPVAIGLLMGVGTAPDVRAQSTRQKFEVASIHACGANTVVPLREGGGLGDIGPSPNRVSKTCVTVMTLIQDAYVIFADGQSRLTAVQMPPIERAPGWISSDLYTIEAKAEGTPGQPAMLGPMMQSLLEDRFKLKLHRESRSGPAYELTLAKGGLKLKENDGTCSVDVPKAAAPRDPATGRPVAGFSTGRVSPPSQPRVPCRLMFNLDNGPNKLFEASAMTIDSFCSYLARVTGHSVVDKTGLRGKYDIRLEYLPDRTPGRTAVEQPDAPADLQPGASLYTAVEQQLGLKLTAVKGTREVIVIDHVEKPSGN